MSLKNKLWNELRKAEQKAQARVAAETNVHFFDATPEGHKARRLLNKMLKKPANTKLKKYSGADIAKALDIVSCSEFVEKLAERSRKKVDSPESKMQRHRLESLLTGTPLHYPPELVEEAKQSKPDKIRKLWDELESLGIEVHELVREGQGIIGFKITTPITTYLDYASPEEILELARRDVELAEKSCCYFCQGRIDYFRRNVYGTLVCPSCRALCGFIPQNLAEQAVDVIFQQFGYRGIQIALENWTRFYGFDPEVDASWLNISQLANNLDDVKQFPILGPEINSQAKISVPLFYWEDESPEDEDSRILPTCALCRYCATIEDHRSVILGVEETYGQVWREQICLYPYQPKEVFTEELLKEEALEFEAEKIRGYQQNHEGIIWNALMEKFVEQFPDVSEQTRDCEACYSDVDGDFHGPICPHFHLNSEHWDLEENGGSYRFLRNATAVFGMVNSKAWQKEQAEREEQKTREELRDKLDSMKNEPEHRDIFIQRVELGQPFREQFTNLVHFLARHFTKEELGQIAKHPDILRCMNLSNNVKWRIAQKALEFKQDRDC